LSPKRSIRSMTQSKY